jgi:hypothetical protein
VGERILAALVRAQRRRLLDQLFGQQLLCENGVPYMDYYVARFWEDLLDATRDLLAGVPHHFNLGYIRRPPSLRLQRIHNRVKIWWREDDTDVVTAVPLKEFLAALTEFDREVMAAMAERLGDDPRLLADHADRSRWLGRIAGGQVFPQERVVRRNTGPR